MKKYVVVAFVSLLMLVLANFAGAQDGYSEVKRPRVGLVLGGGGARGAAHIGVLKELERMKIPIDAIAGTSMGAIVGGLYASGVTSAEIEALISSLDWGAAFKDKLNRKDLRYRRKQDDADFPLKFEIGVRDGEIQLPKGVLQGQRLGLMLRELTLHVAEVDNFDNLAIPFRAVASDLVSGEAVVMGSGDLAIAIRASMSVPGVYAPVLIDDKVLVDGGLIGNVPIDAIKSMDVDIIIAVDVGSPLLEAEELNSAVSISGQMLTILIRKESLRQQAKLGEQDFLIRPKLGAFKSGNFVGITQAVSPGAVATIQLADKLATLSLSDADFAAHVASRTMRAPATELEFVRIRDDGRMSGAVLDARLKLRPGDKIDPISLAEDAAHIYGLQLYEQVDYKIISEDGKTGVEFVTRSKSWGPKVLQFGLSLEDNLSGDTSFNVNTRITHSGLNALDAELRTDLQLGTQPLISTEFYQPLSFDTRYFVAPRISVGEESFNVFLEGASIARYRVSEGLLGLDLGRELGYWGEARLGIFRGRGKARLKVGSTAFPNIRFDTGGWFGSFNVDTYDDAQVPLNGMRVKVDWTLFRTSLGSDENFDILESSISSVKTIGKHTFNVGLSFNTLTSAEDITRSSFAMGGFLNLSGFARGQVSGPHSALAKLIYYHGSGRAKALLNVPLYIGGSLEAGNVWASRSDISFGSTLLHGSLFAGVDTFIGPLFLSAGFGQGGERNLYLSLGTNIN